MNHYATDLLVKERIAARMDEADKARLARLSRAAKPSGGGVGIDQFRRLFLRLAPAV